MKDLNLFKTVLKVQEARSIFRVGFTHLNTPHLNRAYLVTVPFILILAVYVNLSEKDCNKHVVHEGILY